ncbi:integrin alpha-6 isoform X2 [Spea bombifrons]|uniref:integrin alpha-6 isoform X2 n=1 Tax=Spea bombifrons TaxID=233779 RepID=UPI00234A4548|nr:integrin alpha-6 isoform X2 [Spea bombifrons]
MAAAAGNYLSLCFVAWGTLVAAFNLDTENVIRKSGDPGSLFGFSLALHWQLVPEDKRLLLVGAPRTKGFPLQKANVTGGLFACDVTSPSSTCTRIVFDDSVDLTSESKENQWMGVSVQSQGPGGKVVTCAHRYERRRFVNSNQESRDITGRCYVLSQDLTITDEMDGGEWNFCDGRLRGHEKFGSCQQGVAATFTKDYHYVVFGAPGTYNWKGVVRAEHKNSSFDDLLILEDGPYETGGENKRLAELVPVPANSYLGFSLDTGKGIISQDEMTFVSGAPRANHSGAVVLLSKNPPYERMLSPEHIFEGEGLASSFGYDVAVVDLNSDGWQDIVVGAPQFFDKNDKEIGGAIYVYINQMGKWNEVKPIRIEGTKDSMFGVSVKNIGDLNQDGFPDIAVGAPYDDEFGKVYVFHGTKDGINRKPAQVLEGRSTNTKSFGYSIAGNMDLDKNTYPDLAIGSLSDSVNVFRSRPVINLKKTIKVTPDKIDFNKKNCDAPSGICLDVEACFEYTSKSKDYNPFLTLSYTFEVESERQKLALPSRVQFKNLPFENQITKTIDLQGQNQQKCVQTSLQLQEPIRDKLRQIPISVSAEIKSARLSRQRSGQLPQLVPILNQNEPKTTTANVQFLKEGCGEDNVCNSNMRMSYKFCTRDGPETFTELPKENGVPVLSLKDQKDIAVEITVTNNPSDPTNPKKDGDDAHEARLTADLPNALSYSSMRDLSHSPEKQFICTSNQNGSKVGCELGNPFKRNANITFYLILSTNEISANTTDLEVLLNLETTSSQANLAPVVAKARVVVELLLSVSGVAKPSQVYFGGNIVGESAMKSEDDIGNLIEFEFRITNFGRPLKALGTAFLDLEWPKEITNGKWLLYLMKIDSKGLDKVTCRPAGEINKLKLLESGKTRSRREISEKQSGDEKTFSLFSERKYLTLDCNNHARCVTIRCPLQGLDSNAVIVARSRLWNSTFLEEYAKMNYLDILVKASIAIDTTAQNIKMSKEGYQVRLTVFPEKTVAQYTGVPWWIILVAILAGILMLALLVFLLWKCGFFRRDKKDQFDAAYHRAEIHTQPSDKERLTTDA